jgi:hypothetical protein
MTDTQISNVQVHRFGDDVAIYLGDGTTQYISQKEAQELVNTINAAITDIAERPFAKSTIGTYHAIICTNIHKGPNP